MLHQVEAPIHGTITKENNSLTDFRFILCAKINDLIFFQVYCEMGLNGGGYTFVNPIDVPRLTSDEIQSMFTDRTNVLMRVRKADGTQPFAVLKQLPQYA